MDPIQRIAEMLEDASPQKRMAAAVVLAELRPKDNRVVGALCNMAKDPVPLLATTALEALEAIASPRALPVLMEALARGGDTEKAAAKALAALGEDVLPELKARMGDASPEVRAAISRLLPSVGGKQSFALTLEGLRGQPPDVVNAVALSVRHELKSSSPQERKAMGTQLGKFLAQKRVQEDEPALRGALKIAGYLELPDGVELLLKYVGVRQPTPVRIDAATALRFVIAAHPSKKGIRKLMELLEDKDSLVVRAARTTLSTLQLGPEFAEELSLLAGSRDTEIALFAISQMGRWGAGKIAEKTLFPIAAGKDRTRAEAAARVLAGLPSGEKLLVDALAQADEEVGAAVLAESLGPLARKLGKKDVEKLRKAGEKALKDSVAVGRRILDPVRDADPEGWAELLRAQAQAARKKQPGRAEVLWGLLTRSSQAKPEDRYALAGLQLERSPKDLHPRSRERDPALAELERLLDDGFPLARTLEKDKQLDDETRYYLAFHFAERATPEARSVGASLLEGLVQKAGRTKLGKAAKNKLGLLQQRGG